MEMETSPATPTPTPTATATTSSSTIGLTDLPKEMVVDIADRLSLRDQVSLRGSRLLEVFTWELASKRRLCLDIVHHVPRTKPINQPSSLPAEKDVEDNPPSQKEEKEKEEEKEEDQPNNLPFPKLLRKQLNLWRDALCLVVDRQRRFPPLLPTTTTTATEKEKNSRSGLQPKPQQHQPKQDKEEKAKQLTSNFSSSSSSSSLYETVFDKIIFEDLYLNKKLTLEEQEEENDWEHRHGCSRSLVATFRRDYGFRPWLLPSLTDLEVRSFVPHCATSYAPVVSAALAALVIHKSSSPSNESKEEEGEEDEDDYRPIQLTSFAFYALDFGTNDLLLALLTRLWKVLFISTTFTSPSSSSLATLKSLTIFGRHQINTRVDGIYLADLKEYCLKVSNAKCDSPVFPAVEELILGGVNGGLLESLLSSGTVFPALRQLVLVFHSGAAGDDHLHPLNEMMMIAQRGFTEVVSAMPEKRRQQLTHLSVYSFDQLRALHRRAEVNDQKEKYDNEVELKKHLLDQGSSSYGALVAFIREHFPSVVAFNGQAMPSWTKPQPQVQ